MSDSTEEQTSEDGALDNARKDTIDLRGGEGYGRE